MKTFQEYITGEYGDRCEDIFSNLALYQLMQKQYGLYLEENKDE